MALYRELRYSAPSWSAHVTAWHRAEDLPEVSVLTQHASKLGFLERAVFFSDVHACRLVLEVSEQAIAPHRWHPAGHARFARAIRAPRRPRPARAPSFTALLEFAQGSNGLRRSPCIRVCPPLLEPALASLDDLGPAPDHTAASR